MGLKAGLTLFEQCAKYAKACGKTHILQTLPQDLSKIDINNLKLAKPLVTDTFVKSNEVSNKLLHLVKKKFIEMDDLGKFFANNPNANRRIGSLPYDWIKGMDKAEIAEVTNKIDGFFKKYAERIQDFKGWKNGISNQELEAYNKELTEELKTILKRDDISIEYTGHGVFKTCQKIKVGNHTYALSSFKNPKYVDDYGIHQGYMYEPQNSFAVYKQAGHGRVAKPFMARTCRETDSDGYILTQFLDGSKSKTRKGFFSTKFEKITTGDDGLQNCINNVYFDFGGTSKNIRQIKDKQEHSLVLRFVNILDSYGYNGVTNTYSLKQLASGKDILSKSFIENIDTKELARLHLLEDAVWKKDLYHRLASRVDPNSKLYEIIQKIFKKQSTKYEQMALDDVKILKKQADKIERLMEIKKQLVANGTWGKYETWLNEDFAEFFPIETKAPFHKVNSNWNGRFYPEIITKILGIDNTPKAFGEYMESSHKSWADVVGANIADKYSKSEVLEYLQKNKILIPKEDMDNITSFYPNIIEFKKAYNFTDKEMSSMIHIV